MAKMKPLKRAERLRRLKAAQFRRVAEVRALVGTFTAQSQLDSMLLQQEDPMKRKQLFDFVRPFCRFANPTFPTSLEKLGGVLSVKPKLIRPPQAFEQDEHLVIHT